jgi:hypothetical protein
MPRPPSRPPVLREGIGLSPLAVKMCLGVILLGLMAWVLWWINAVNDRLQAERRIAASPALAGWLQAARREIADFERQSGLAAPGSRTRMTEAVWVGTVKARELNNPANNRPQLIGVTLQPAHLLAGRRSPKDERGDTVRISVKDFHFATGEPQRGEPWVFSVARINGGFNFVRDARPMP